MPRTATRHSPCTTLVVSPVFLSLSGGTNQRDGQIGLVLLREAMQTAALLHLIMVLAACKPDQLHASLDLFSELPKEPFVLQQRRKSFHAPSGSSQFQQLPFKSYPKSQVTAWLLPIGPLHTPAPAPAPSPVCCQLVMFWSI